MSGQAAILTPRSSGFSLKYFPFIQVYPSTSFIESKSEGSFYLELVSEIRLIYPVNQSMQAKCCATVDWFICQCHIYMERDLLEQSHH